VSRGPLSIRARVTIAATAAVALVLIGGGVLTVATFASRERSSFDRELERRAQGPALRASGFGPESGPESVPGGSPPEAPSGQPPGGPPGLLAQSGSFVRVIRSGSVVQAAGDVPTKGFPLPTRAGFATVDANGRKWRTLTIQPPPGPLRPSSAQGVTGLQFAADLGPVEDRIDSMRKRVGLIAALGTVLAAVLASLLSGLALGPLSRLRRAVAGISDTRDLSQRLPDRGAAEEVNELARSVNAMLTRLERSAAETEEAFQATRRFAADVGHELRTPLTSIRANLDAIRRNPSMPDADQRVILDEVTREQHELVELLDALQALARGDAGASLPREQLDFAEIVDAAVGAASRRHPTATIELTASDEREDIEGWPDGLRLLADNLIENAVRHGGSRVEVDLRRDSAGGDLVLSVSDDGPGVPEAERERVFERFARGSQAIAPGTGLGLALVAQQASLHGGSVHVGSSPAGGACFTVRLSARGSAPLV
jgi:two-component system sensor histidine kinase PrrB